METRNIILNALNEELIPYDKPDWLHSVEHTVISETNVGYIPLHWHSELQFVVVTDGMIELIIKGKRFSVSKSNGFFINSGVIHEMYGKTPDATFICWNIGIELFDQHIQNKFLLPLIREGSTPFLILNQMDDDHKKILEATIKTYNTFLTKEKGFELEVTIQYLLCLSELLHLVTFDSSNNNPIHDQRVKMILANIHKNYQSQISLEQLAEISFLSKSETIRLFKKHVGKTPFHYICNYRLDQSINLLRNTDSTVTEIASKCGFSSASYFIEKFKSRYHITPKQYRKKAKI